MKKRTLLSGYHAKIAMIAVALTGGLLTGCYKDESSDLINPSEPNKPAPEYSITGSILDAQTFMPVDGLSVEVNSKAVTTQNGSYTVEANGGTENKIIVKGNDLYEGTEASVFVEKINAGQNVIYTKNILVKPTMNGTWNVSPYVTNENGYPLVSGTDYTYTFKSAEGQDVTGSVTNLPAGTYSMNIDGKGKYNGMTKMVRFELSKIRTDNKDAKYVVNAILNIAPMTYTNVKGYVIYNGKYVIADVIKLKVNQTEYVASNTAYYSFDIPNSVINPKTKANVSATLEIIYKGETLPAIDITISDDPNETNQEDYNINTVTEDPQKPYLNVTVGKLGNAKTTEDKAILSETTNALSQSVNVSFDYTMKSGTKITPADYMEQIATAGKIEAGAIAYNKIRSAILTEIVENYTEKQMVGTYLLPARSILTPTIVYNYISQDYKLALSGTGANAVKGAEGVLFGSFEVKTVKQIFNIQSIDHDHSHSHGNDLNSGGGIVEAE